MSKKPNYKLIESCVYFPGEKILVVGDLHFGYEQEMKQAGFDFNINQVNENIKDLKRIIKKCGKIEKMILLGDIKHSFGRILKGERQDTKIFFEFLNSEIGNKKIILIKGNHDVLINQFFQQEKWKNVEITDFYLENKILFFHGHTKSFENVKSLIKKTDLMVVGHFHTAVALSDGEKTERFKCFLKGKIDKKNILIVPSFFPFIEGSDVLDHPQLLREFVETCEISVVAPDGEVLDFGKVNKLIRKS